MRRLNDITAFRRYWYHTSLVEALFIGSKKHKDGDQLGTPPTSGEDSSSAGMCLPVLRLCGKAIFGVSRSFRSSV